MARRRGRRRKKLLDRSHLTQKLPSKTSYLRKDKGDDGSGKKTRKKTYLDWSHLTQNLPSKTSYLRKEKEDDGSGKKTRKKT